MSNGEFGCGSIGRERYSPDDNVKPPESWFCIFCERENRCQDYECRGCERPRYYQLSQGEARAVARKLNRLETENKGLSAMLATSTLYVARLARQRDDAIALFRAANRMALRQYEKQPCGHEQRFIVEGLTNFMGEDGITRWGMGWCALCVAESKYKTEGIHE